MVVEVLYSDRGVLDVGWGMGSSQAVTVSFAVEVVHA